MLTTTTALALIFSSPPTAPPDRFDAQLDHVDVTVSDGDALLVALDSNGETIGSIALWVDNAGITWIAADYEDGYAMLSIDPFTEAVTHEGDLPAAELADRADAVLAALADPARPVAKKHSWIECGGKTVLAGIACWTGGPIGCVFGAIKASCACVPKLIKEFEPYECPWGL